MKLSKRLITTIVIVISMSASSYSQIQKGGDIDGTGGNDESGNAVCMPDANTIAIGARYNEDSFTEAGHVRIFLWNGNNWVQKGNTIEGEAAYDFSGNALSMSDSNTIAIGAWGNDGFGGNSGHVRIYYWDGSAWVQKGDDIDGENAEDQFGYSVSMGDSNTIAIGAPFSEVSGDVAGDVRIFKWDGSAWVQKGNDMEAESFGDRFGWSVSMADSNTLAIGAPYNDGNGMNDGHTRIFRWNGAEWLQKGIDIDGESVNVWSGWSVSMPDSNCVAIGAIQANGIGGGAAGHARVFTWDGFSWVQKGDDMDGEIGSDNSGCSISMPNVNTIAIGVYRNDGVGTDGGHVRVYIWNGLAWVQKGIDLDGESAGDESGSSVCMPDSNTVAIGAPRNVGSFTTGYAGHSRVYDLTGAPTVGIIDIDQEIIEIYPNPAENIFYLKNGVGKQVYYNLYITDVNGEIVYQLLNINQSKLSLSPELRNGFYFVEVIFVDGNSRTKKLIVN